MRVILNDTALDSDSRLKTSRPEAIPVLLVEDDPAFVTLLQEWLAETATSQGNCAVPVLSVALAENLATAITMLQASNVAAVIVDLNLPDSQGMATFTRLQEVAGQLPILVLSGLQDEVLALQAMRLGAQDYLIKSQVTGPLLDRAVRYAIERLALRQELFRVQQQERRQQERQFLDQIVNRSSVSAELLGVPPIKQSLPELFRNFSDRFAETLDWALETRTHRVERDLSGSLAGLARELSFLKCGPRDVVEIYLEALNRISGRFNPQREQAYSDEGRLLTLQLMGLLVSQYRPYALSNVRIPPRECLPP
jgi:DNA-binding NarL/FixJ family response regulator